MAKSCCFAQCQGPIQAAIRPGLWLPGVRNLHLATETWTISSSPQAAFDAIVEAVGSIADEENLIIRKERKAELYLEIWSYTPYCNWLDIVEIRLHDVQPDSSTNNETIAEARSFSSGLFPACCPLGFIFSSIFFWVPFSGNNFNTHRLEAIRKAITSAAVTVSDEGPTCC
ncbi:PREDICTED: uncharacterized protein LOC100638328 [Amphimedon queenslandica]|uniref:Uncharacterized protein n=1 Tax=Amphimedon queenslandica TaxID=400682 RepID=A0A1X7VMQ0_AMPQE|nr:PREDICTED: uncharacterized protein LOC100638328 [Amphimedon queenslandica]|eukprot:XP_003383684.1 PREDICTED: uncharacterized protein LOC100638328 [Amphimedon queenslandica]